jgi:hypothetical protein
LLHAADTGERLFLPDKITWSALREEGSRYRVYLNFLAWQPNGERLQAQSNQFIVDLEKKTVQSADETTRQKFFEAANQMQFAPASSKAADIEALLGGVDALNKQKLHAVIMKSDKQKDEKKKSEAALKAAEDKLLRQIVYFRTKYAEKTLQNVGKAYLFSDALKGK